MATMSTKLAYAPTHTVIALTLLAASCGGELAEGRKASAPGDYFWETDKPAEIPKGGFVDVSFGVSLSAKISFSVVSRSTTSPDRFDVGILDDSQLQYFRSGQVTQTLFWKSNVGDTAGAFDVPAGSYHFLVRCVNLIGGCAFTYSVSTHL